MQSKKSTINVTNLYTIQRLINRDAGLDLIIGVITHCYCPYYNQVTFLYKGCIYIVTKDNVKKEFYKQLTIEL